MSFMVLVVCCVMFAVPVSAILILKLGVNRFIHETEQSLIQQGAIYSSAYAAAFEAATRETGGEKMPGYYLPPQKRVFWNASARTFRPLLDLRQDKVLPVRPGAKPVALAPGNRHRAIAPDLELLSKRAGRTTLSNVLFLDHKGRDLHASTPEGFAELPEVNKALNGGIGAVLRWRRGAERSSSFIRLNRGTGFRVFVAYPVISENRVIGAVYLSRTPDELGTYLSEEWLSVIVVAAVTAIGATLLGILLVRQISRPIMDLRNRARALARGDLENLDHLQHYGTRELAQLGDAVVSMARTLSERSTEISTYTTHVTHELKAPVTAIISASELLEESSLPNASRRQLLETLKAQGQRMERLLNQLRDITRLRQQMRGSPAKLADMLPAPSDLHIIATPDDAILPLSLRHGQTVFAHLVQNAIGHGAGQIKIVWRDNVLEILDNGEGFEDKDISRLTEPFYTTRRDSGGTGLGLSVVNAILERYGTRIEAAPSPEGALFRIAFPVDSQSERQP